MMGSTHAATGILLGAGVGFLTHLGHQHGIVVWEGIGRDLLYGAVTGGLALLPDADHPQASFAHAAGPLSHGVSHLVGRLFGGHRGGTHSIPGTALFAGLVALAVAHPNHWSLGVLAAVLAVCIAAGLAVTGFARHGLQALVYGCAIAGVAVYAIRPELWWLVILGMGLHIVEDEFSGHGCALLWPFTTRRFGGDGHQPAKRKVDGRRPAARRPATRPARTRRSPVPEGYAQPTIPLPVLSGGRKASWVSEGVCLACATRDHGDCVDKTCPCTRGKHTSRPGALSVRPPAAPDDGAPPPF
jgi:membrane-bound metal-dependent hydrolase YbcI (DUF457 family)